MIFKRLYNKFIRWHDRNKYSVSYAGEYLVQYIIDKYLNDKEDYIQRYENTIERFDVRKNQPFIDVFGSDLEDEDNWRFLSAIYVLAMLMNFMDYEQRESYFNQIQDGFRREAVKIMVGKLK